MGMKIAGPEVEFTMTTASAEAAAKRLGTTVDATTAASVRAYNKLQREVDTYIDRIERETAVVGMNAQQIKAAQAAALLLRAEQSKDTGLVARLRAAEQAQYDASFAAMRHAQALEREAEEARAAEAALQSAAAAHQAFERAAASGMRMLNEQITASDRYAASLEAQVAAIGQDTAALKQMEVAQRAAAADATGRTDIGDRIRASGAAMAAAAADADRLAASEKAEASAAQAAAAAHMRLAEAVRASNAADEADAASLEQLRRSIDPTRTAMDRLNKEIEESTRLYRLGKIGQVEYGQQQQVLTQRINQAREAHDQQVRAMRGGSGTMTQLSFQLNDIATMASMGAKPMQIFASQAGQIFQVAQMAEGGIKGFATQVLGLTVRWAPLLVVMGSAAIVLNQWKKEIGSDAEVKNFASTLGLTHKEMKKLGETSITTGDMIGGFWKTITDGAGSSPILSTVGDWLSKVPMLVINTFKGITAAIYGLLAGSIRGAITIWQQFPQAIGDFFTQAANVAISAIDWLLNKTIEGVNALGRGANDILSKVGLGPVFGQLEGVHLAQLKNANAGAGKALGQAMVKGYSDEVTSALGDMDKGAAAIARNVILKHNERLTKKANEIKADRTPEKPKVDHHAEQLARENEAIEAQIRNLYKLADAYGVSDAAALIAEARVKAESKAIKQRGDIEAAVNREVRLVVAQRVSDTEKAAAAMRQQTAAQKAVNDAVAAGNVPAADAADVLRDRIALLPILAAQQAALGRGDLAGAFRATAAMNALTAAQTANNEEVRRGQALQAGDAAAQQIAMLQEEARLVGATDAVRVRALATLKATQEAQKFNPADRAAYVAQQQKISDLTEANRQATDEYNASLSFQAELFDEIDRSAQDAARGIADAFGDAGRAIGDALTIVTGYYAEQASLQQAHDEAIRQAGKNQQRIDHENALYATRTATAQIGLYGDLASAAKGFFSEQSKGYKVIAASEKAFRIVELAMAVKNAAVQLGLIGGVTAAKAASAATSTAVDTAQTAASIANAGARAAADGVAAMAKTAASSSFPFNLAGMAVMAAALASIGIVTGFGGGGGNNLPKANEGKGTVLGDNDAQSKSIERAIDLLRDVDTVTMTTSRAMLDSLRKIEANIGNLASLLVRTGDIDASAGVNTGFKTDLTGKLLGGDFLPGVQLIKQIPVLGDIIGGISGVVKSLFGSKTSVIGSGLFGGPQAIADVLNAGFDVSYFSDVKKTKKFFGISAGSKYSTQYGDASGEIEQQFGLILRGFYDTIAAAAPALGQATGAIEDRLAGFVVNIGKIDLKDLTGEEIQEKLQAVFGAAADDMARAALPGLEKFQAVGEGYFETLARVAMTVETVSTSLARLGANAQHLGIDGSMALAGLFDSVSDLSSAASSYFETYFTEAEQTAIRTAEMGKAFASVGMTMPDTIASFRSLVEAQDLNTEAGRSAYAILLQLAPAFADLQQSMGGVSTAADILRERQDLERQLLEVQGDSAAIRADDLSKIDASNRALQQHIWALRDQAEATAAATQAAEQAAAAEKQRTDAIAGERSGLERRLLDALGDTAAIRGLELAALDPSNRALQERIYAIQDEQAATAAATQAAQAAAQLAEQAAQAEQQRLAGVASERVGLERQLLEATGNTNAIRALELAALDESNRAIQQQIWALADQAAATTAAAAAAQEAAAKEQAITSQRAGLMSRIWELTGDTAAIRAAELAALDPANRALQERIYMIEAEQAASAAAQAAADQAAQAAEQLADAWRSISDTIMDEVKRIRGEGLGAGASYASLLGQFNAVTAAARMGDQAAAKSLTGLSQSMLEAAANAATSGQELDRVRGVTAASLEETARLIGWVANTVTSNGGLGNGQSADTSAWWSKMAAAAASTTSTSAGNDNAGTAAEMRGMRADLKATKEELTNALRQIANHADRSAVVLEKAERLGAGNGLAVTQEAA